MKHLNLIFPVVLSLSLASCDPVLSTAGSDLTQPTSTTAASSATPDNTSIRLNPVSLIGVVRARANQALISNATVRINSQSVQSDSAGFFQLDDLPQGEVKLIVIAPGYQAYTKTLTLKAGSQVEDIDLSVMGEILPEPTPSPTIPNDGSESPNPSATASPQASPGGTLILLPDGSASVAPTPTPSPSVTPTPVPTSSASPAASATPEPPYDPILDEAVDAQVLISRQNADLRLTYTLTQVNGLPVNWSKGTVQVEYFLASAEGEFLTSGRSVITANGDGFVVSLGSRTVGDNVIADYVLTLPNLSQIKKKETLTL